MCSSDLADGCNAVEVLQIRAGGNFASMSRMGGIDDSELQAGGLQQCLQLAGDAGTLTQSTVRVHDGQNVFCICCCGDHEVTAKQAKSAYGAVECPWMCQIC